MLLDFEAAAIGPREWDLLPTAIATERYGLEEEQYRQFADAYGFDVRDLARLSGAARDPGADDDDMDHAERRREPRPPPPSSPCESPHCEKEISDVPGTSSDQPASSPAARRSQPADPAAERRVRITNMYATPWHLADGTGSGDLPDYLRLWRFERYYRLSADQLPRVLVREALDVSALRFQRWQHAGSVTGARIWLFRLPSGQIVAALSLDAHCELAETIDLLEDCYFGDMQIGGTDGRGVRARAWPSSSAPTHRPSTVSCPNATRSSSTRSPRPRTAMTWSSG